MQCHVTDARHARNTPIHLLIHLYISLVYRVTLIFFLSVLRCDVNTFSLFQAYDEFLRMRQCIVRYSPTSAVYTRECFEYLISRMGSAAIYHFSKRNRMSAAKGVLGSLPVNGPKSYEYPSYFTLPYGAYLSPHCTLLDYFPCLDLFCLILFPFAFRRFFGHWCSMRSALHRHRRAEALCRAKAECA
jgi:hypothetical protein